MLLERDDLLAELRALRDATDGGHGALVFLGGEAGSGKTTLVTEFLGSLDRSTLSVVGNCDPLTTPRPLGPLIDFSRDPDAGLEDVDPSRHGTFELFEIVLDRVRSSIRPMVLVIEDIHWADEATLDFIRFIGRRITDSRGLVVCTYRDDEVDEEHPVRPVLGDLAKVPSTRRIAVPNLSESAVTILARGRAVDSDRLHEVTNGNAFFVTEILASGDSLPDTVTDAVLARAARLDRGARDIVEAVSVAPRALEIDRAISLAAGDGDAVDRAVASGMLRARDSSLEFRHDLARSAIEASLSPVRRLGLHRRMIRLLEDDDVPDVARLAHHASRAGDGALVVRYAPRAASEAVRRGARREGISFYRAALSYPELLEPEREARLQFELGWALSRLERSDEAMAAFDRAVELYRSMGDVRAVGRTLIAQQSSTWQTRGKDAAWGRTEEARLMLELDGPSEELALVHYRIAHNQMVDRQRDAALAAASVSRRVSDDVGSFEARWRADLITGCVEAVCGDSDRGIEMLTESLAEAEQVGDLDLINTALGQLGSAGGEARDYAVAVPALRRGVDHAVATDDDGNASYNRAWLARVSFERGEWDEAARLAEVAHESTGEPLGVAGVTALCALGRVRVRRGDPGGIEVLDEVIGVADDHLLQYVWNAYCGRAEYAWLTGHPLQGGDRHLRHAFERAMATDSPWAKGEVGFWMWRAGLIDGPPDDAAEPFALQMAGEWRAAAERWESIGCPYEHAMALADGDDDAVLAAVEILDGLGAAPAARMVRGILRDRGVAHVPRGPSRATRENPAGMTNRQLEVLALMAEGLSNAEIADRLYVSKKTVEHHVSAVLSKLEADNRTMAVTTAIDRGYLAT